MSDAIRAITMPKWGMTMTEGTVADWLVAEGERIEPGAEFLEVETDKITNVVEAPEGGTLRRIVVPRGETAPCGSLIAVIADEGVPDADIDGFVDGFAPADVAEDEDGPASLERREIEAGGVTLSVVTAPGGDAVPVLLIHGFGADAETWLFNQEALAGERAVHAVELPSHGRSAIDPDVSDVASLTNVVVEAIDELGLAKAHLVGHSLGGRIALAIAASRPGRVASLSLIAPAGFGEEINAEFIEGFVEADRRRGMKAALRLLVADPKAITSDMIERTLAYKRIDGVPKALRALADAQFAGGSQTADGTDDLARVEAPVLSVWGAQDAIIPPAHLGALEGSAETLLVENAGHMPHMEASAQVNEALLAHIARAESAS